MALTDEAIGKIKEMIISGRVRPGEKLPREADLAAELGLSRNSLREAVKALSLINVLDVRQGDGTYATSLEPSLLLEALSFIVDFHRDDTVLDFLEVRRILEPAATGLAALRMTSAEKDELGQILEAVTTDSPVDDFVAADLEFHKKIAMGSGNLVLASLVDSMSLPTARARIWRGMTQPRVLERTLSEHQAIYQAIVAGDPALAQSWATVHISGVVAWLNSNLTSTPPPPARLPSKPSPSGGTEAVTLTSHSMFLRHRKWPCPICAARWLLTRIDFRINLAETSQTFDVWLTVGHPGSPCRRGRDAFRRRAVTPSDCHPQ